VHDWVQIYVLHWTRQVPQVKQQAELKMADQLARQITKCEERE
jgi:hypothetical protein